MNVLALFSGIGGLELGLERAGMTVVGQVEIDKFCQRILKKHWPEVPRHDDVHTAVEWWRSVDRPRVDLVCGGFPCPSVSVAGKRRGQADERWLWPAMADVIRGIRPRYVLMENVPGILAPISVRDDANRVIGYTRAPIEDVLADLAALGYDADWQCIPAAAVGALHLRWRWFCVAHANSNPLWKQSIADDWLNGPPVAGLHGQAQSVADTDGTGLEKRRRVGGNARPQFPAAVRDGEIVADAAGDGWNARRPSDTPEGSRGRESGRGGLEPNAVADPDGEGQLQQIGIVGEIGGRARDGGQSVADPASSGRESSIEPERGSRGETLGRRQAVFGGRSIPERKSWWAVEPDVGRVAHGIPHRVDRLKALGNSVVPQVAEFVGRQIMEYEA